VTANDFTAKQFNSHPHAATTAGTILIEVESALMHRYPPDSRTGVTMKVQVGWLIYLATTKTSVRSMYATQKQGTVVNYPDRLSGIS